MQRRRSRFGHWLAKRRPVSDCYVTTYSANTSHARASICQNGIDSKLCALGSTLPVEDRRLFLLESRHPVVDSTHLIFDSRHPVVDFWPQFSKFLPATRLFETWIRQPEAFGRRLEALFRQPEVLGRQSGAAFFIIRCFKSAGRGFRSFAQTVRSITRFDDTPARRARLASHHVLESNRVRARPG